MPRPEKVAAVAEIKDRIENAKAVFLAEYSGLSVKQQQELRRGLKEQGAEFKVVKMTLARLAVDELDIEAFDGLLLGPTGIAFADDDAVSAAKVLKEFSASHDVFTVKGGLLGGDPLSPERINQLAEIEPRDVLLAKLAGAMKAPLNNMASLMAAMPRSVATMIQQLIDKKVAAGDGADEVALDSSEPDAEPTEKTAEADAETAPTAADTADEPEAAADGETTEVEAEPAKDTAEVDAEAGDDADDETDDAEAEAAADDESEADEEPSAEEE